MEIFFVLKTDRRRPFASAAANLRVMHKTSLILAVGTAISLAPLANGEEIEFSTLPQPVQTTVMRETHIVKPSSVTRVVRSENGIYTVTVRRTEGGERLVYVNSEGAIVQAPVSSTTTTTTTTEEPTITYETVQQNLPRYQLLEEKDGGKKMIYLDRQTGKKVHVERDKGKIEKGD